MNCVFALTLLGLAAAVVQAAGPVGAKAHHASSSSAKSASSVKAATTKASTGKGGRSSAHPGSKSVKNQHSVTSSRTAGSRTSRRGRYGKTRVARAATPSYQTHPDPERYQEIQKALVDRGYLKTEPNGQWDNDSVDALKHFQADQQLDPDGKISARTLIGLGLGPKHDGSAVASAAIPPAGAAADQSATPAVEVSQ